MVKDGAGVTLNRIIPNHLLEDIDPFVLPDEFKIRTLGNCDLSGLLLLAGIPNMEPMVRGGPLVMNTKEGVRQTFEDCRRGKLHV